VLQRRQKISAAFHSNFFPMKLITFGVIFLNIASEIGIFSPLVTKIKRKLYFRNATKLGGNSQNFLGKFVRFFITLRRFYIEVIHRK